MRKLSHRRNVILGIIVQVQNGLYSSCALQHFWLEEKEYFPHINLVIKYNFVPKSVEDVSICYHLHPKEDEGNVFTGVCLLKGGGTLDLSIVLALILLVLFIVLSQVLSKGVLLDMTIGQDGGTP